MRVVGLSLAVLVSGLVAGARAQQIIVPLWPQGPPERSATSTTEKDLTTDRDKMEAGKRVTRLTNVTNPTLAVFQPSAKRSTNAAVLVFPGGGYKVLAYDLEGSEACEWLNSIGVTCVLVKYRVPFEDRYPANRADLEDAQQAMRIVRSRAAEWHIDPNRIGVLGFSAGAHLAVVLSIHGDDLEGGDREGKVKARPDFAMILYPGYLVEDHDLSRLSAGIEPTASTCPTFLIQAEDDPVHEENVLRYYQALKEAKVPAEIHIFSQGGHGYGLRHSGHPISHWPELAETWLHTIHVLEDAPR